MSFTNRNRFTGMSGLDVNDMVTQLMRAHSMRLDRLTQNREIFVWQQEMVRGIADNMRALQGRVLANTGPNVGQSVMSRNNFNVVTGSVSNNGVTVPGVNIRGTGSGTTTGNRSIQIHQAARGDSFRGATTHNQQAIVGSRPGGLDFDALVNNFRDPADGSFREASMVVQLNMGRTATFVVDEDMYNRVTASANPSQAFLNEINDFLGANFGDDTRPNAPANSTADPNLAYRHAWAELDANGNISFSTRDGNTLGLANNYLPEGVTDGMLEMMGIDPSRAITRFNPNNMNMSEFLGNGNGAFDFTINNTRFEFDGTSFRVNGNEVYAAVTPGNLTVQQVISTVNSSTGATLSFNADSGRFSIASNQVGAMLGAVNLSENQIGGVGFLDSIGFMSGGAPSTDPAVRTSQAQDAVVTMDGQTFVRDSNRFTIGDIEIEIIPGVFVDPPTQDSNNVAIDPPTLTLNLTKDTSRVREMITNFIAEYNSLIESIRDLTEVRRPRQSASAGGGFFMPLTDEQRRSMSEREIELWEGQARRGILNRDNTLRTIMSDLHREIMNPVQTRSGGTINLIAVGIRTDRDLDRFGRLEIDEDRLNYFLENNLDDLEDLFASQSSLGLNDRTDRSEILRQGGVGQRVNDILRWSMASGGSLNDMAGTTAATEHANALSRRIAAEDRRIDNMIRDLQRREDLYFQKFARLEAAMLQSNSQMMFMEQMFWGA